MMLLFCIVMTFVFWRICQFMRNNLVMDDSFIGVIECGAFAIFHLFLVIFGCLTVFFAGTLLLNILF